MNNRLKYVLGILAVAAAAFIFYNKVYIPKHTYAKVTATKGEMDLKVFGIGTVGAKNIYNVNALTASKIKDIKTDEGKWVKKGDLLVVMDPVDLPELVAEAKIAVLKAQMEVSASRKDLDALKAQKHLSLLTFKRYEKLKEQSFASQSEYDKAKADLDAIEAQIAATKAHIDSAKHEVVRAQKSVKALQEKLSRYKIYAPVDGYVIAKEATTAQSVVPTQPILKIVDAEDVWIKAYIDEKISGDIEVGQKATITLRSKADEKLRGYVKRIVPQSDAVTQEREVDVAFEKLPIPFYMNEQAEVFISTKHLKNVFKIPVAAIIYKDGRSAIWLDEEGYATLQKIDILGVDENFVAVRELPQNAVILIPAADKKSLAEGMRVH